MRCHSERSEQSGSAYDFTQAQAQSEIPGGVYPEQTAEILRYAQDDSEWARNDTVLVRGK